MIIINNNNKTVLIKRLPPKSLSAKTQYKNNYNTLTFNRKAKIHDVGNSNKLNHQKQL